MRSNASGTYARVVWLILALVGTSLYPMQSSAFVAVIDTFRVTRNADIFLDTFDAGGPPPSGPFGPTSYGVQGGFPPGSEVGGKLVLDTANGAFTVNALGEARQTLGATLLTSTTVPDLALWVDDGITVGARFDLVDPTGPRFQTYGIQLIDAPPGGVTNQLLQVQVAFVPGALIPTQISYINQDFTTDSILSFGVAPFAPPPDADQVVLGLVRIGTPSAPTNQFLAFFEFFDGATSLGRTDFTNLGTMFEGENFVRARFFAATAVPEPGILALLLAAACGVLASGRGRRAQ